MNARNDNSETPKPRSKAPLDETKEEALKENKMGTMPIPKLLITMALPMIISMLVMALYNVVDSVFVARISENALVALTFIFTIQNLMIASGNGIGVGINAILSRSLGEKDSKQANSSASQGLFLIALIYIVFLLFGIFGAEAFMGSLTDIEEVIALGTTYLRIICIFSFGIFAQLAFERLLISTGRTFYTMITQGTGAIINIILDPILIFGMFGFPQLGVAGAAIATVIGQCIAALLALYFYRTRNEEITLNFKRFRPNKTVIKAILVVGVPTIILQAVGSVMNFGMNYILIGFSATAVAVFGICFRLQSMIFMPVFGLANGLIPIIAYNFGARNKARVLQAFKLAVMYAVGFMLFGFILLQAFPHAFLNIFSASEEMIAIGTVALRVVSISLLFAGFGIISGTALQALGDGINAMLISLGRQLIVLLPAAYLLSLSGNVNAIWWSFPIAEIASITLCIIFLRNIYKKKLLHLDDDQSDQNGPGNQDDQSNKGNQNNKNNKGNKGDREDTTSEPPKTPNTPNSPEPT